MALYTVMKGPVAYTVVGSPTITDGVASGFSSSNYLSLPATIDISQNFDWVFCITTDDLSTEQRIFAYNTNGINSIYIQNKYLKWFITANSSSNILSTDQLQPNTKYFIKCTNVNGLYSLSYSTDGITYTGLRTKELSLSTTISSYYDIGVNHTSYYSPFLGSIDLNNTYIKVNDQLWFGHAPQRVKIRTAPYVRYTVVGSPTITDGVASNFSSSNLITLPSWKDEGQDLEEAFSFILPTGYGNPARAINQFGGGTYEFLIAIKSYKGGIEARLSSTEAISVSYSLQLNTKYTARLKRVSGVYTLDLLDSAGNVLGSESLTSPTLLYNGNSFAMRLGNDYSIYGTFPGYIDLNNSYIKVNGQYWWRGDMQYVETYTLHQGE